MLYVIQVTPNSGFSMADYINITLTFLPKLFYFPICVDPSPPCQRPCGRKPERPEKPTTFNRVLTNTFHMSGGASWPKGSPFTSEVADSIFSENVLNVNRTQWPKNVKSQHSAESRGFSPSAFLRFGPTGKLTGWVRINTDRKVKSVVKIASLG